MFGVSPISCIWNLRTSASEGALNAKCFSEYSATRLESSYNSILFGSSRGVLSVISGSNSSTLCTALSYLSFVSIFVISLNFRAINYFIIFCMSANKVIINRFLVNIIATIGLKLLPLILKT